MRIGFTGTQRGMTDAQRTMLREILTTFDHGEFHHGDCIGSDAQAHEIALECGYCPIIHPPSDPRKRAWCEVPKHLMRREYPYMIRNHHIVDETGRLIATPAEFEEQLRSGTWSTWRYAKRKNCKVVLILPNGIIR